MGDANLGPFNHVLPPEKPSELASSAGSAHPAQLKHHGRIEGTNLTEWKCPACGGKYPFVNSIARVPICRGDGTAFVPNSQFNAEIADKGSGKEATNEN
jgi:hypothetical protein